MVVARQGDRLELLDDISGVMNIMGWKGCETVYYWRTVWLHLYPNTPVSPPASGGTGWRP
jgi:hypothetical protein